MFFTRVNKVIILLISPCRRFFDPDSCLIVIQNVYAIFIIARLITSRSLHSNEERNILLGRSWRRETRKKRNEKVKPTLYFFLILKKILSLLIFVYYIRIVAVIIISTVG